MNCKLINTKGRLIDLEYPIVMGILNLTPDSFYANSRKQQIYEILKSVEKILLDGALILDIGAQSTRPNSKFLSPEIELERLIPPLSAINREFPETIISVDTFYADVAKYCVNECGVSIINDVSGGELDSQMFSTVAELNVPYVLMHMRGTPQTMQQATDYDNLLEDISLYFSEKVRALRQMGVNDIILDPGFGFAKDVNQNYQLMNSLKFFQNFELPLLVGISRKSVVTKFLNVSVDEALNGTAVLNTFALLNGANILRVHDVREAVEAIKIVEKIKNS